MTRLYGLAGISSAVANRSRSESVKPSSGQTLSERLVQNRTQTEVALDNASSFGGSPFQFNNTGIVAAQQLLVAKPDEPGPVEFGQDYYEQRAEDFTRRNPGMEPPDYYLEYGDKYVERFASLDGTDLSPEGLEWRDKTLNALQEAIEAKRIEDPEGFAELERDPEAFREFAYGTHPDAYVDSGLFDLPIQDILVIGATPDIGDVLTQDGIGQTLVTLGKLRPNDLLDIAKRTVIQTGRDAPFVVARQAERIIDRLRNQDTDWIPDFIVPDLPEIKKPDIWPFN